MSKVRKGRQSIRKVPEVPDEIFRQAVNLPKAERYEYISLECATVIARLIKELRIKQGRGIRVNFYCIDMKDYKYFGFSTRNRQLENCQFLIEGKRYTFFLSVDNKNSYGVQNDDYLRILAIYSVLHRMYKKRNKRDARNEPVNREVGAREVAGDVPCIFYTVSYRATLLLHVF